MGSLSLLRGKGCVPGPWSYKEGVAELLTFYWLVTSTGS